MPDYKNGKIYALRSYKTDNIYIGSTTQTLSQRLGGHKRDYKRWLNGKKNWCSSYEIIKQGDYYIELIEYADCKTKAELCKKEGEFIRKMKCVNKVIAGRDMKQYHQDNKEHRNNNSRQYYKNNREKLLKDKKQYNIDNQEKIAERRKKHYQNNRQEILEKKKIYHQKNKERIIKYQKEYRQKNKELLRVKDRERKQKKKWKKKFNEVLKEIN